MKELLCALLLLAALSPSRARADGELVDVSIEPWSAYDGVDRPYRYIIEMRSRAPSVELVADHRLLRLELRDGRRPLRCAHPAAPGRVSAGRVRTLAQGRPGEEGVWREFIDLRMYCAGRALEALDRGAEVAVRFGWPRRGRERWVARPSPNASRESVSSLELGTITFPPMPPRTTRGASGGRAPGGGGVLDVELAPTTARTGRNLALRVAIFAASGTQRIFVRPDSWSLRVRGPLGDVTCDAPSSGGPPPPELFRRVTVRAPVRAVLDPDYFCPPGTFELAGVYEITPEVELPHAGTEWGFTAATGRFAGPTVPIRVSHGDRGYIEQAPGD